MPKHEIYCLKDETVVVSVDAPTPELAVMKVCSLFNGERYLLWSTIGNRYAGELIYGEQTVVCGNFVAYHNRGFGDEG